MPLNPAFAPIFLTLTAFGWLQLHGPAATKGLEDLRPACAALENPYRVAYVSWGGKTVNGMLCVLNTFFATLLAQPDGKDLTAYYQRQVETGTAVGHARHISPLMRRPSALLSLGS
ncbi:hypothetical protein EXIGLDRAFT_737145 [Exidia glandulosa HHB12029]|uniref:Uncharacterized protein n=1 Tax=Exidia glandulosa HHB12029 TaxID=1314781 RepID=A0A166N0W2_EXIGL|nr:hypothetical protein EXIGLDRAFT_737145 [Exidia glandulosa HHB12029]